MSLLALALAGCGSIQIPLTPAEEAQLHALGTRLGSEVRLQYDPGAVNHQQPNGTVIISVTRTVESARDAPFCGADSLALQQQAGTIAAELVPQLRFARYHRRIAVVYNANTPLRDNSQTLLCYRIVSATLHTKWLVFQNQDSLI